MCSIACIFVFQSVLGHITPTGSGDEQFPQNPHGQRPANGHHFLGIFRQPVEEIAQRMQTLREQERQQRIERQHRLDERNQNEQENHQAVQWLRRLRESMAELRNLEANNDIDMDNEQQENLRIEIHNLMQQVRQYIIPRLYNLLQDYDNSRYYPSVPNDLSEEGRIDFLRNLRQRNQNQYNQINELIPQEIQRLEGGITGVQQEINQIQLDE